MTPATHAIVTVADPGSDRTEYNVSSPAQAFPPFKASVYYSWTLGKWVWKIAGELRGTAQTQDDAKNRCLSDIRAFTP